MPHARQSDPPAERFENSPIAWFAELLSAIERGDFRRANEAQRQLSRLGWSVAQRKPRQTAAGRGVGR